MTDINKTCMSYLRQQLYIAVALFLVCLMVMQVWYLDSILVPAVVSVAFTLVLAIAIGLVWRRVATGSPESLPTFFTAVSGFRLLLALAVMFVWYLVYGRGATLVFFLVFMAFYIVSLAHHSIFFARVSNRS
ncbi:MAG: hypothetical protein IJ067_03320 [Prevotella sp.]|nr:hypothetical protein [Prevotella sp.]